MPTSAGYPSAGTCASIQNGMLNAKSQLRRSPPRSSASLQGIDRAMAAALGRHGFDDTFLRPVFHGVGIEHEEAPIPGGHAVIHGKEKIDRVQPGMVLGIGNCGIYREEFGVRMEDTVWVSEQGPGSLTTYPKTLTV